MLYVAEERTAGGIYMTDSVVTATPIASCFTLQQITLDYEGYL